MSFRSVDTAARLDSRYAGLSYEKDKLTVPMFTGSNAALIQLFGLLGASVLRIGANQVDRSSWQGEVSGLTPILPKQVDALAAFIGATQWQVIYGVNLAQNTPGRAAREAAYAASRLGASLLAVEIGNEPDLYRRLGYRPSTWAYKDYLVEWRTYRDAIAAAAPGVSFSGPATSFDVDRYTLLFARDEGPALSMLTHHYYRGDRADPDSTLSLLLDPDVGLARELAALVPTAASAGIAQGLRLAEANSYYGGGVPGVSNAYGTALWVMDFMFTCALAGCTGVNMHGGGSGPGYTPIADRNGVPVEARPEYYGMTMFAQAAQGQPLQGQLAADADINITAYAIARGDGGRNIILINKDGTRSVGMDVTTGAVASQFQALRLAGPALRATTGQTLGGVAIGADGSWAPTQQESLTASDGHLSVVLAPASAVQLRSV